MEAFRIVGGARLDGEVRITGAKNSVLKLMAASLLAEGTTTLREVPSILDVEYMAELLRRLGCTVVHDPVAHTVVIDVPAVPHHKADYDLVRRLRASINVLGPLLARCGEADVTFLTNPVSMEQLKEVAFAGDVMPQKSTDFFPKLLSGLTIYALD